jgi:hypothetical protein
MRDSVNVEATVRGGLLGGAVPTEVTREFVPSFPWPAMMIDRNTASSKAIASAKILVFETSSFHSNRF